MERRRVFMVLAPVALALGATACSSSPTTTPATPTTVGAPSASAIPIPTSDRSPAGAAGAEPTVVVPKGTPGKDLEVADLIVGTGPTAKAGDTVTVQYVLATYSARKVIQSSWTSQPFEFVVGQGQVIPGWDRGVAGMQAGGRRELIIPASLGYGSQSPGAGIAPNDTLVFIVDLLKIG